MPATLCPDKKLKLNFIFVRTVVLPAPDKTDVMPHASLTSKRETDEISVSATFRTGCPLLWFLASSLNSLQFKHRPQYM